MFLTHPTLYKVNHPKKYGFLYFEKFLNLNHLGKWIFDKIWTTVTVCSTKEYETFLQFPIQPTQITTLFLTFLSTFSNSPKTMREIPKNIEFCCKITHNTNTVHERQVFGGWWFLSKVYRAFFSFNGRRFDALLWTEVNLAVRAFFSAGLVAVEQLQ